MFLLGKGKVLQHRLDNSDQLGILLESHWYFQQDNSILEYMSAYQYLPFYHLVKLFRDLMESDKVNLWVNSFLLCRC